MDTESPRVLVLGAGQLHRAHFRTIQAMGCVAIGMDRNPEAPARTVADEFYCGDPSDTQKVIDAARTHRADAILPLSEFGVISAAQASVELGLKQISIEAAHAARSKAKMRRAWQEHGVTQPGFQLINSAEQAREAAQAIGFPLIIKPTAQFGARGTRKVIDMDDLDSSVTESLAYSDNGAVLEQCIEGVETSVEGGVIDGQAEVLAIADKELWDHPTLRVTKSINYPGAFSDNQVQQIEDCAADCVAALGLNNCPFHLEVFVTDNGVVPIECGARGGGGHIYSEIVRLVSGVDLVRTAVQLLLDEKVIIQRPIIKRGACYRFLFPPAGRLMAIHGLEQVQNDPDVVDVVISVKPGDLIDEPEHGPMRVGCVVTKGEDRDAAIAVADRVEKTLRWDIQPADR